jgi:YesN/AraC family two-component response regulator
MNRVSIIIFTNGTSHKYYDSIAPKNENIEIISLKERKAVDLMNLYEADLVLIDCGYDTQRGLEAVKDIKSAWHNTPIIFLTDMSSENIVMKAFKSGAREYFKKPVNLFELKNTVELLLDIKRRSREKRISLSMQKVDVADDLASLINLVTSDMPENILKAVIYMKENLSEADRLEKLAQEANLSKYHFCRMFKKFVGISPVRFVTILKINKAKELLRNKDLTISIVCEKIGYNDLSNFERQFKNITGMTPTTFKESIKPSVFTPPAINN